MFMTATPQRLRHCPMRIARRMQGPSPSMPASPSPIAHTGRWKLTFLPPPQPVHGESTNSPLRSANVAAAGALGDGKEHVDVVRHGSAFKPQPRADIDQAAIISLQGHQTCRRAVRFDRHGQWRRIGADGLADMLTWVALRLNPGLTARESRRPLTLIGRWSDLHILDDGCTSCSRARTSREIASGRR